MNAPHFERGDMAMVCNKPCSCCNGLQVVVLSGPFPMEVWTIVGLHSEVRFGYTVLMEDGTELFSEPHELRRVDPPADVESHATPNKVSTFDPLIWVPSGQVVLQAHSAAGGER